MQERNGYEKMVIPVVAILVVGIGALIFGMSMSYAKVQYQKDTEAPSFQRRMAM